MCWEFTWEKVFFFVEYARARYNKEQAGAELCQAQAQLWLAQAWFC